MAHWRDTYKPAKFFIIDARAGLALAPVLLHITWWTFGIAVLAVGLFWYLERAGLDTASAGRAVRAWFAGAIRPAKWGYKVRSRIDYDRMVLPEDPYVAKPDLTTRAKARLEKYFQNRKKAKGAS